MPDFEVVHVAIVVLSVLVAVLLFAFGSLRSQNQEIRREVGWLSSRVTAIETAAAVRPAEQCSRLHVDELRLKRPRHGPEDEDESNPVMRRR